MIGLSCPKLFLIASAFLLPGLATAQEDDSKRPCYVFQSGSAWNCSLAVRGDFSILRLNESLPSVSVPEKTALVDLNVMGKTDVIDGLRFSLDSELIARRSWTFKKRNVLTGQVESSPSGTSENPAYRLALNEAYFFYELTPEYQFTLGKKRILWGSGFASNPTDVLNPGKNVLDPTLERRGSWLLQAERIQEKTTIAAFFAPGVEEDKNTLPKNILSYKAANSTSEYKHFLTGARWYQLVGNADINVMLFHSERYKDEAGSNWKYGASWSQSLLQISKQLEGHAEILLQKGSQRTSSDFLSRAESSAWHLNLLIGSRYDFDNESALIVEFFRQSDGDSRSDLKSRLGRVMALSRNLRPAPGQPAAAVSLSFNIPGTFAGASASQSETSRAVSSLSQQNYLFANWQRYKFTDDLLLSWSVVHNLHDSSGFQGPVLQWNPSQSSAVTLSASSDYALFKNSGVLVEGLGRVRENELNPVKGRIGLEIKSYF